MRRMTMIAFAGVIAYAILAMGCLDRKPAPVCPVPTEIASNEQTASDFDGVDLLVMVDNSTSMTEEQNILSTGFFTLINSLTKPLPTALDLEWGFPPVKNMRVAVVVSDMGLQWGNAQTGGNTTDVPQCMDDEMGKNGEFQKGRETTINVFSGQIKCESATSGQCPEGWDCNANYLCMAPGGVGTVNCPGMNEWAQTTSENPDADMTSEVACMAQQGSEGCGIEQQLQAAVRGLEVQPDFMLDNHLLAILIVSDEEDCSIRDKGLFETEEWRSGPSELLNVACNYPPENETFLFPTNAEEINAIVDERDVDPSTLDTYFNKFVALKGGQTAAVIFAAIVGVPRAEDVDADLSPCEGDGSEISKAGCLDADEMQIHVETFETEKGPIQHFTPACVRKDGETTITEARPGRRYVRTAQEFGPNGYVYSICNEDWSPAMKQIAEIIARQITATCYSSQLDWELTPKDGCEDCGVAKCDVVVEISRSGSEIGNESCDDKLYAGISERDAASYKQRKTVEKIKENGVLDRKIINCPLPKLATPLDCDKAKEYVDPTQVGWYYCEKQGKENFDDACKDGVDNDDDNGNGIVRDGDDLVDCEDPDCDDCPACKGTGVNCEKGCRYGVEITDEGKNVAVGQFIKVQCLQRFSFEDSNCQEDSAYACQNGLDDDGNGVWDCINTIANPGKNEKNPHLPDPYCCPIEEDADNNCKVDQNILTDILGVCVPKAKRDNIKSFGEFWAAIKDVESMPELDACRARIADLGCTVQQN